jgi:hypothetical protein
VESVKLQSKIILAASSQSWMTLGKLNNFSTKFIYWNCLLLVTGALLTYILVVYVVILLF